MSGLSRSNLWAAGSRWGAGAALGLLAVVLACKPTGSAAPDDGETRPDGGPAFVPSSYDQAPEGDDGDNGDNEKWDVQDPPGEGKTVELDVREGTWMSLDVSPDGETIVFDLLGDLYRLPRGGGDTRSLTSGMAWDMQPRFSPDGKWIAFTSDRGGGDNIWVIPADGGEARQVTSEDFRLVNSPAWSPDGQFIAARKHFTAERSLGSGEIWLYHLSGGAGVQMTEKPNDQKDVGEPAFSPDGKYVYFSRDATPGAVFEYNKDPHAGIYAIDRLDREDGRIETLLSGVGGAVRPTPSPDGKQLAYVRREGLETGLFLYDLVSGADRELFLGLDRDMQETWAIHGVYPSMGWTPDSKAIVFWAGGKLHEIDVATKKVGNIPFRVKDTREVRRALRFAQPVHPKTFHTKMLRWVSVSPDETAVVYQALGHLWIRELPGGKPRRLTRDEVFEFYPSWSRDSKRIVYTTWSDGSFGEVRVVARRGGSSRQVTRDPGHYIEPAFSPDGQHIVYRKVGGGWTRSSQWSHDLGLYVVDARGGASQIVRRGSADGPHFGTDSNRVFFATRSKDGDEAKSALHSIELSGAHERTHARSKRGQEFRVSPDGKWLAICEHYQAFIAPFPAIGRPFELGPKAKNLPIRRVSDDAGEYLHWSGDSERLYWSLGPELLYRELKDTFAFLDGAPEKKPPPPAKGLDIGFDVDSDQPKGRIALVGGRIVTMKGDEVIEDGTVLVQGNRIEAVGPRAAVTVPGDATSFDVSGMTVIPGLVDVHAHGSQGEQGITPQQNWLHYATLAFGVTTIHDPSNDTGDIFAAAELARAGLIVAPRIFSTGTILYGAEGTYRAVIDNIDDARDHLRRMKAVGAFSVKSYNQPRRDQRQQVVTAARELQMMVVPEGGSLFQHNMNMVVDGHTGIEHAVPIEVAYEDVVTLWSGTEVGYTPTIGVGYGGLWGENYWYAHTEVFAHPRLQAFVPPFAYEGRARRRVLASEGDYNHIRVADLAAKLEHAGVEINLGAHGQREGLAAHWELWMFVQGGMTPHEALRAGTLNGAHYVGLDGDIGSIEAGKLADFAVIEGNPLQDIRLSERVRYTVLGGRVYDAKTMAELAPRKREPQPFFWERPGGNGRPGSVQSHADH